jgi:hypothetical protein
VLLTPTLSHSYKRRNPDHLLSAMQPRGLGRMKTLLGAAVVISLLAIGLAARLLTSAVPCAPKADDAPCGGAG